MLVTSLGDECVSVWSMHAHVSVPDSVLYGLCKHLSLWVWIGLRYVPTGFLTVPTCLCTCGYAPPGRDRLIVSSTLRGSW